MKRIKLLGITIAAILALCSFEWEPVDNKQLRADMLSYATSFRDDYKGEAVARKLDRFIRKQQRTKDQFSWIPATYQLCAELKAQNPPYISSSDLGLRRRILELLDYPAHFNSRGTEDQTAFNAASRKYICDARESVLDQLEHCHPSSGIQIWQIYNMGYILRTSERTIAIDIAAPRGIPYSDEDCRRIAEQIDVLLLTHPHEDHFCENVMLAVEAAGKPIVLPCEMPFLSKATVLDSDNPTPVEIAGIKIVNFLGNQGAKIPNNVYLLEFDGFRLIDSGDNYDRNADAQLSRYPAADIIIAATWNEIQKQLDYFCSAPGDGVQLLIPSHQNELSHGVKHRESFHEMFNRSDRLGNAEYKFPAMLILDNGEGFHYKKEELKIL